MIGIRDEVDRADPELTALASAIESGASIGGEPSRVVAALALAGLGPDLGPPLVRANPPRPGLLRGASESALAKLLPSTFRDLSGCRSRPVCS